ncbi:hypothetical protein LSH36_1265g00012 [Paralvinella palmiformis]|uniref:ADP-ribosyl cyclase/cyclic ADP-ribose hydrolase n=1 Tax=Paralvinella palmiformis TaxID=53620 RepID=A0AAD9MPL6_9ANNE|nr:hypothetical protein LSH36_1265g00012 [Paralvinella palmiformis]
MTSGIPISNHNYVRTATNRNLKEIFLGRCWEFQELVNPDPFVDRGKDCDALWGHFTSAFAYKEPCATTDADYEPFATAAVHALSEHENLFWESVYPFVTEFSSNGKRYTTIADTLLGYMVDQLQWCGQLEDPGINYDNCPTDDDCEKVNGQTPNYSYWLKTSDYFSAETIGRSSVLLNGSHQLPFDSQSIFATRELVNLRPELNVSHLHIIILHDLGGVIVYYHPDVSFAVSEICLKSAVLDHESNRSSG